MLLCAGKFWSQKVLAKIESNINMCVCVLYHWYWAVFSSNATFGLPLTQHVS